MNKDIVIVVIGIVLFVMLWIGWGMFEGMRVNNTEGSDVFCTADVKRCSDGSYVGRTPPHCNFAQCPGN
ncbi:MAG: hypothetical protein ACJKTH_02030 [Patescibacteria group bacterium UBA2163]